LLDTLVGTLAPAVRDRLISETGGNPLALEELPATLGREQLATVLAAGRRLGVAPEALKPPERAGLVQVTDSQLRFCHPLVRSAIYQAATFTARQAAHRALVQTLSGEQQADRRAWHLAPPPDWAATRRWPGCWRPRPAALERAAALTPDAAPQARRLVAAAGYLWEAGHAERAQALLDRAQPLPADLAVGPGWFGSAARSSWPVASRRPPARC
jgi:hypothetical protein